METQKPIHGEKVLFNKIIGELKDSYEPVKNTGISFDTYVLAFMQFRAKK